MSDVVACPLTSVNVLVDVVCDTLPHPLHSGVDDWAFFFGRLSEVSLAVSDVVVRRGIVFRPAPS